MKKILFILWILLYSSVSAEEYANTSYYIAYDQNDKTQYVLVMPAVNKIYTHKAGQIQPEDLKQIDTQFIALPTYENGMLCFSELQDNIDGSDGADMLSGNCYGVDFFYTQTEQVSEGIAFILYYSPTDKVYEGLAGKAESFKIVKDGIQIYNENSITSKDYSSFVFDVSTGDVTVEKYILSAESLLKGKTVYTTIEDQTGTLESWTFDEDMQTMNWQELVGGSESESIQILSVTESSIVIEGENDDTPVTLTILSDEGDYLRILVQEAGDADQELYVYFDEAKAREYFLVDLSENELVGTWYISDEDGEVMLSFFSDGSYMLAESGMADAAGQSGMERGTYSYLDGVLTVKTEVDTNGEWGLSDPSGGYFGIEIINDQLTLIEEEDRYTAIRVIPDSNNVIVGSWYMKESIDDPNKLVVITFLADGTYMMAEDSIADEAGQDGMELGIL